MAKSLSTDITTEVAKQENRPIELYVLFLKDFTLYFASNDQAVTFFQWDEDNETTSSTSQVYTPIGLSRNDIENNINSEVDKVTIKMDNVNKQITTWLAEHDFRGRRILIFKVFADLLDDKDNFVVVFDGIMDQFGVTEQEAQFVATTRVGNLGLQVPRRVYQSSCNWVFGDTFCTFDKIGTGVSGQTAQAGSTEAILVDSNRTENVDHWRFGDIEVTSGVNKGIKRRIVASSGSILTFDITYPSGIAGDNYTLHRGCPKTQLWCSGLVNLDNFGGFPTIPDLSGN